MGGGLMKDITLAMANQFLLPKFEAIEGVASARFEIKETIDGKKLKLNAIVNRDGIDNFLNIRDKIHYKAIEIEEELGRGRIITFTTGRKEQ